MRLYEKLRPKALADVVGQSHVTGPLATFLLEPYPSILMLSGPTGCGKTATAMALSDALADTGWFGGSAYWETGPGFDAETVDHYFSRKSSPFRYQVAANKFHVLRVEELERVHPIVQNDLKEALEDAQRRYKLVVIATSNDPSRMEKALLHRFQRYTFEAGAAFRREFNEWLEVAWYGETGFAPLHAGWQNWGQDGDEFSARLALDKMEQALMQRSTCHETVR